MAGPIDITQLTADDLKAIQLGTAAPTPTTPTQPTEIDISSLKPEDMKAIQIEPEGRFGSMVLNGLTFGARPRLAAAWKAGGFSGPEYEAAKKEEWAKDDAYMAANPGKAIAGEVLGSVPTMFVPGLGAARVAQAANSANQVAQNLSRTQRFTRALGLGKEIGTVGQEAGALGLKTGALAGGVSSREDSLSGKIGDAAVGAPVGYVLGRAGQAVGDKVARGAEHLADAVRYGGDANVGALNALQTSMRRSGVEPQAIRSALIPDTGRAAVTPEAKETILRTYGEALSNGASESAARAAARNSYRGIASVKPKVADSHVKAVIDSHSAANDIPLAIDELAQMTGSRAQNMQWTRRAAMNTPGEGRDIAAEAIMGRQEGIIPQIRERITKTVGTPDFDEALNNVRLRNQANSRALYDDAFQKEVPFDLSPALEQWQRKHAFLGGPVRDTVDQALATMRGVPNPDGTFQRHTLDTYIQSRGALNDMIAKSMDPNTRRPTNATRMLVQLKGELDSIVGKDNPSWVTANARHAEGMAVENAMRKGEQMSLTSSPRTREALQWLKKANDDEKEAFKIGFARVLHNELSRLGDTHDVSKIFLKGGKDGADGVRRILREALGDDAAKEIMDLAQRSKVATRTFQGYGNSQTTPLAEAMKDQNRFGSIAGLLQMLRPMNAIEKVGEMVGDKLNEKRNVELLKRLSIMSNKPNEMFGLLDELQRLQNNRLGAFTSPGVNAYSGGALVGSGVGVAGQDRRNR